MLGVCELWRVRKSGLHLVVYGAASGKGVLIPKRRSVEEESIQCAG